MENNQQNQPEIEDMSTPDLQKRYQELKQKAKNDQLDDYDLFGARLVLGTNGLKRNEKMEEEIVRGVYRAELICVEAELQERAKRN